MREATQPRQWPARGFAQTRARLGNLTVALLAPLAQPAVAGLVALIVYLVRARFGAGGWEQTRYAYFNWLADAFLHRQLHLLVDLPETRDLIANGGHCTVVSTATWQRTGTAAATITATQEQQLYDCAAVTTK